VQISCQSDRSAIVGALFASFGGWQDDSHGISLCLLNP
jgi:hypothetical protein